MPLDDADKAEIAELIKAATQSRQPPRATPPAAIGATQSDWDQMGERDRQAYVRTLVEENLASLDAEAEREELRQQNKQMKAQLAEWEKGGKRGPRPTKAPADKPETETPPTLVSKAYSWLFGDVK